MAPHPLIKFVEVEEQVLGRLVERDPSFRDEPPNETDLASEPFGSRFDPHQGAWSLW